MATLIFIGRLCGNIWVNMFDPHPSTPPPPCPAPKGILLHTVVIFHISVTSCCDIYNGGCDHTCIPGPTIDTRTCECDEGFVLAPDGEDCLGAPVRKCHCIPLSLTLKVDLTFCIDLYTDCILSVYVKFCSLWKTENLLY